MVAEASHAGRTVFMSSHVLSEVQQTAQRVGIVRQGRLVTVERVETLRERAVRESRSTSPRRCRRPSSRPCPASATCG
jgi:ABC-type multidrug transport system ATPase subunit